MRTGEITKSGHGSSAAQGAGERLARQRVKAGRHLDRNTARNPRSPKLGRAIEHVQPLLADRRSRITTHWRRRRRIIEPFARSVLIHDQNGCRLRRPGERQCCRQQMNETAHYFAGWCAAHFVSVVQHLLARPSAETLPWTEC
jgi:hypothetical protein